MLGPVDYILWFASAFLQVGAVVCAYRAGSLGRYFTLNLYLITAFLVTVGRYFVYARYGFPSEMYSYFYYYSGTLLTVFLYFALMGLYSCAFEEMGVSRYLRVGALLLLAGTAWFSYQIVAHSSLKMLGAKASASRFVVELSQNLYFVGLVLTYLLWGALLKLRETRVRLIQLVAALGVYFSAFAANYSLHNLHPGFSTIWKYVPPLIALWLPLAWSYTFLRVPEEARIATARVAAIHHK